MNNEEGKNNPHETEVEINLSKFVFVVMQLLPPLVLGRFFGVIVERCAYGLIILLLALRYMQMVDVLSEIKNAFEMASEDLKKKIAKKEKEQEDGDERD